MKYKLFLLILFLLIGNSNFAQPQPKIIKPDNIKTKILIKIAGKNREYFPLDEQKENILSLRGPGKLKIITRARFKSDKQKIVNYSLIYKLDGAAKVESKVKNVQRSKSASYKNASHGVPGDDHTLVLNFDEGEHNIQVWGGSKKLQVDARYIFVPSKEKKMKWVSLTPLSPNEPVNIVSGEQVVNYYRFSESKPLKLKITGPTKLRILTRIENHYNMKGRIYYRLKINENGTLKNTYQLSSVRSESTVYKTEKNKVPGRAKEIVINVPAGTYLYEILPLDKGTLLGKVLFPKKDMKLEE